MSSNMLKINAGIKTEANIWIKDTAVKSVTKFCLYWREWEAEEGNALLQATVVGQMVLVSPGRQIIYMKVNTDHKSG
jgi:hypothetical protein